MSKFRDIQAGKIAELNVLPKLNAYFGCNVTKTKGTYSLFDFEHRGDERKFKIELKSRRNKLKTYPTTMVGYNKIQEGMKLIEKGYEIYFCFQFTDGLYIYQLHENSDADYSTQQGGRWDRGKAEIKKYAYIDVDKLTEIRKPIERVADDRFDDLADAFNGLKVQ